MKKEGKMSAYKPWRELERSIVRELKSLGFVVERNWSVQFEKKSGRDITAKNEELVFCIQCKYGERPKLRQAFLEAVDAKKQKEIPLGICRFKNERDTLVVMSWRDFKKLLEGGEKNEKRTKFEHD